MLETHPNDQELTGRVALVTGGAGGVGLPIARALADRGAQVVIAGRRLDPLEQAAAQSDRLHPLQLDVTSADSWRDGMSQVAATVGEVDILVTSAGTIHRAPFVQSEPWQWDAMLQTNLIGSMLAVHALLPGMLERAFGRIVLISSVTAHVGCADRAVYGATKGGLEAFARAVAVEAAGSGVTVNCVAPGAFRTEFNSEYLRDGSPTGEAARTQIPEGRFGDPEEIARAILYLVTSNYSQGSTVRLDGGWSIS